MRRPGWRSDRLFGAAALETLVALSVACQLTHLIEAPPEALEQASMEAGVGRSERVVLPEPGLPDAHESRAAEVGEVARDRRLRRLQDGDDVPHADLPVVLEEVKDAQPRAIGEGPEHPVDACASHGHIVDPQNGDASNEA